jgi:hypothetical protein
MTRLGGFTFEDAQQIYSRVLGKSTSQKVWTGKPTVFNLAYYARLQADLVPATNELTGYSQAIATVIRYLAEAEDTLNMEETTEEILVTNRSMTYSAQAGDLIQVGRLGSEWAPVAAAGGTKLRHGVVTNCLGGGYYYGAFVDIPTFKLPGGTDQLGTGSGTGTYILNSDFMEGCDHCLDIEVDPTFITCGSLKEPPRTEQAAGVQGFYCYDPRKLALNTPTHVIVADLGDVVEVYPDGDSSLGTGTGTGIDTEKLWMIVTGTYPLVAIPDRYYKCCDGEVILVRCDNFVVEGHFCPGDAGDCPTPGTGSSGGTGVPGGGGDPGGGGNPGGGIV